MAAKPCQLARLGYLFNFSPGDQHVFEPGRFRPVAIHILKKYHECYPTN
jgi:hypothetical protein